MSNDRLKFRVWDKENNCYVEGLCLQPDGTLTTNNPEAYEVEFCRGAFDENNNLIYCGDILEILGGDDDKPRTTVVDGRGFIEVTGYDWDFMRVEDYESNGGYTYIKIIGNIHKNPEYRRDRK